ncbi:MAG: threonylcarbamoyl-AMP synthase [Bacteroidales bacterium]|nr:threonylcarbamoyl-AMP synthase [Bacteroidales bacterium]
MTADIKAAIETLTKGGIILYPTDTIWGLGCDATRDDAVNKIYQLKKRMDNQPMLVLLDEAGKLDRYVTDVPEIAWDILEVTDKPLTIIYPGARNLAESLVAPDGSVGIRIVQDEFCSKLIHLFGKPIVSTSANISGKLWPDTFKNVDESLVNGVDYVVRWRQDDHLKGKPSGIIKLGVNGEVRIIRE